MSIRRMAAFLAVAAIVFAACSGTTPSAAPASAAPSASGSAAASASAGADDEFVVGVSWNNYDQPRWACCDAPGIRKVVEAAGGKVIETVAANSTEIQLSNIDGLIAQGMDVLILLAKDPEAMQAKIEEVKGLGIPIIGYDRLVEDPDVFYLTFDNQGVGRIMAEEITKVETKGNFAIVKGHSADPNADFLRAGMEPVLSKFPDIKIPKGCEDYNDNWNTENARNMMTACLAATNNDIQGVISENDSMATGVVTALQEVGLAGTIPVTGQDGDFPALNRVALGTQLVSVWKDSGQLGKVAGELAIQLHEGKKLNELVAPDDIAPYAKPPAGNNAVEFTTPGNNKVWSITLNPNPVLRANLNEPIDSGWVKKDVVCAGVKDTSAVPACA
ncbi:MAG TPA: substrate-binding domain-containing protein [Candidatus Limnocylindrales bacterium]|nr:substrate-binding domain-containing protein [Candidatus Limnocylindrales bacterium]